MDDPSGTTTRVPTGRVTGAKTDLGASVGESVRGRRPRIRVPIVRIVAILATALVVALALVRPQPPPPPAARSTADPFAIPVNVTWSPDGRKLAYVVQTRAPLGPEPAGDGAGSDGRTGTGISPHAEVWVVNADGTGNRLLERTPPGPADVALWWSPDGDRMVVGRGAGLEVLPLTGEPATPVRDARSIWVSNAGNIAWATDGRTFLFDRYVDSGSRMWIGHVDGLATPFSLPENASGPIFSPSGRLLLFSSFDPATGENSTWVAQADGSAARHVGPCCVLGWGPTGDAYIDDGQGGIRSYPVLGNGDPSPVVEGSGWRPTPAGWIGLEGSAVAIDTPSGRRLLTTVTDVEATSWPNPSPSGRYVAFFGKQAGKPGLFAIGTDGHGAVSLLWPYPRDLGTWSPNDEAPSLAFIEERAIVAADPVTGAVRTIVPRESIAGPALSAATDAVGRIVIGPDGPTADIVSVSASGGSRLDVVNESAVSWRIGAEFEGAALCSIVRPDGSLGAMLLGEQACVAPPHTTIAVVPGPTREGGTMSFAQVGWAQGDELTVLLEPER